MPLKLNQVKKKDRKQRPHRLPDTCPHLGAGRLPQPHRSRHERMVQSARAAYQAQEATSASGLTARAAENLRPARPLACQRPSRAATAPGQAPKQPERGPPIGSNPQFAAHLSVSRRRPRTPRPRGGCAKLKRRGQRLDCRRVWNGFRAILEHFSALHRESAGQRGCGRIAGPGRSEESVGCSGTVHGVCDSMARRASGTCWQLVCWQRPLGAACGRAPRADRRGRRDLLCSAWVHHYRGARLQQPFTGSRSRCGR